MAVWVVEKHGEIVEQWWKLKDVPNGKILMSLSWLETSKDISVLESKSSLYFMNFRVNWQTKETHSYELH